MLLAALYVSYDLTLTETTTGRDLVAESEVARAVVRRVGLDLQSIVTTLPPKSGQSSGSSSSSSSSGGSTTSTDTSSTAAAATGTGGMTAATTATTTTTTTGMTADATATSSAVVSGTNIPLQSGVVGSGPLLVVFASRPPKYLSDRGVPYDPTAVQPSDLVRVVYYLHSQGRGLCRQEKPWLLAEGVWNSSDADRTDEDTDLIAPEVTNVTFEFASGTGYVSDWDGSTAGTDGSTNQGPPRAVKMTLDLEFAPPSATAANAQPVKKQVVHVFPIRAAVGPGPATSTTTTDSSTTGTGTTTTGGN